jgi:hypothetical protein
MALACNIEAGTVSQGDLTRRIDLGSAVAPTAAPAKLAAIK